MPSVKEQLQQARDLIQQERYNEARRILRKVDHPTAQKWLDQLDTLEGKRAPASRSRSGRGGARRVLVRLLMVVVVFGLIAGIYVLYENGTLSQFLATPEPTQVALGPDGRPLPTPTPEPSSTPIPCEPQLWWDEQEATAAAFLNPAPLRTRNETDYQAAVDSLRESQAAFAEVTYPDCLADLHRQILAYMDTQLARLDLLQTRTIAFGSNDTLEPDAIRQYGDSTTNALEQMRVVANTLAALQIDYDDSGTGFSRTVVEIINAEQPPVTDESATPEITPNETAVVVCPSLRWLYTEYLPSSSLIRRGQDILRSNTADTEATSGLVFDLQREAQRLSGQTEPACLDTERGLLIQTNQALAGALQNLLDNDSAGLQENRNTFNDALTALTEALRMLPAYTLVTAR